MANQKTETTKKTTKKNVTKKVTPAKAEAKVSKKQSTNKQTTKEIKKVVKTEEPMANIMDDEKKENKRINAETFRFVGSLIFWIVFAVLAFVWITDFIKVTREEKPVFCVANKTHEYEDGTVTECVGLGYKVYTYDRESLDKGVQFGPFFIKIKEPTK